MMEKGFIMTSNNCIILIYTACVYAFSISLAQKKKKEKKKKLLFSYGC